MDLENIKRGLRAEIKKRENEQYFTFQCNVRQMCKDVLAKLEEQESEIEELKEQVHEYALGSYVLQARAEKEARHDKYKRCLAMARMCEERSARYDVLQEGHDLDWSREIEFYYKWYMRWLKLAEHFKPEAR